MGREVQEGERNIFLCLIHVDVWKKSIQYCNAIILQLKINKFKEKEGSENQDTLIFPPLKLASCWLRISSSPPSCSPSPFSFVPFCDFPQILVILLSFPLYSFFLHLLIPPTPGMNSALFLFLFSSPLLSVLHPPLLLRESSFPQGYKLFLDGPQFE